MKIKTIFYQGIYSSQIQLAKYLSPKGFISTTNEKIECKKGVPLIINPFIGKEIDEIEPFEFSFLNLINPFKILSYIFAYIGRVNNYIDVVSVKSTIEERNTDIGSFKDKGTLKTHFINFMKFNFGQLNDIANHYCKYIQCLSEYPDTNIILWGVSKGAATTLNAFAKNNYESVKMIVLEGCFTDIESVFKYWSLNREWYDPNFIIAKAFLWLLKYDLLKYIIDYQSQDSFNPINNVHLVPHHIPVILITSDIDKVVPTSHTLELYNKLLELNHPNVHLLQLKKSRHHAYTFDNEEDYTRYYNFIHDLYKKYGII